MRKFRLLNADEIECRISSTSDSGVTLLLYKTARVDYALFDEVFGEMNWQCRYELINGTMYCGIGVYCADRNDWVWKWNCGTESRTEAEKGQASDGIKRAGFVWGCGTELYTAPHIWVSKSNCNKNSDGKISEKFKVTEIGYDSNSEINRLTIVNKTGKVVFNMGEENDSEPQECNKQLPKYICTNCGCEIISVASGGKEVKAEDVAARTQKAYGKVLCAKCAKAAADAAHEG